MKFLGSCDPALGHRGPTTETFHNEFGELDSGLLHRSHKNLLIRYSQNLWRPQMESTSKYVNVQMETNIEVYSFHKR